MAVTVGGSPISPAQADQLRAVIAPDPITARLTSLNTTDDTIYLRAGVPHLVSVSVQADAFGGSPPAATAPAAFTAGQWTAEPTVTPGEIGINITALPSDGGSAITALEYRVGTGAATALTGTGTGLRVVTAGFTAGVAADIQVRAVNAVGAGAWSDTKNRTPAASGGGSGTADWIAVATTSVPSTAAPFSPAQPAGLVASDLQLLYLSGMTSASRVAMTVPSGWTLVGEVYTDFAGIGHAIYRAAGNTAMGSWSSSVLATDVVAEVHRIAGANLTTPVRDFQIRATLPTGTFDGEAAAMPAPSATAAANDLVLSFYQAPQSTSAAGTGQGGYTRVVDSVAPNTRSVLLLEGAAAGATGEISHGHSAAYQHRNASTLVVASS